MNRNTPFLVVILDVKRVVGIPASLQLAFHIPWLSDYRFKSLWDNFSHHACSSIRPTSCIPARFSLRIACFRISKKEWTIKSAHYYFQCLFSLKEPNLAPMHKVLHIFIQARELLNMQAFLSYFACQSSEQRTGAKSRKSLLFQRWLPSMQANSSNLCDREHLHWLRWQLRLWSRGLWWKGKCPMPGGICFQTSLSTFSFVIVQIWRLSPVLYISFRQS